MVPIPKYPSPVKRATSVRVPEIRVEKARDEDPVV